MFARTLLRFLCGALLAALAGIAGAQVELGLAEVHAKGYPTEQAVEEFARLAAEYSQGSVRITVYPGGEVTGNERTAIEMVQKGTVAMARVSSGALGAFNARMNVFGLPYLFDSKQHLWAFLDGPHGRALLDGLATSGLVGLCWYDAGARSFYAKKPLRGLADLKGLRVRTHDNPVIMRMALEMGASAVPLATDAIAGALENGTVDAAENNAPTFLSLGHYRIARHYLLNEHLRLPEVLFISRAAWERLDDGQKAAIRRAAAESVAFQRARWDAFEAEALATLARDGVEVLRVADLGPFRKAVRRLIDDEAPAHRETLAAIEAARSGR